MATDYLTSSKLDFNLNNIYKWVEDYYYFLNFYHRKQMPLMINNDYLAKAQFHIEEGRGGYFAPESGTSEAQFLTIKGLLKVYKQTKDVKYLSLAEEMADAAVKTLFNNPIPTEFDENNLWLPHWLYNAANDFTGEKFYTDKKVSFVNGIGSFQTSYETRKVFSARSLNATLDWNSPFAKIIGKSYEIKEVNKTERQFTIKLNESFTGQLLVVYSDFGGETIKTNELYEAYPVWRKLQPTEVACAIDSLFWGYDVFKDLAEVTNKEKWANALSIFKHTIPIACDVANLGDYFTTDTRTLDAFSTPGTYSYQTRSTEATFYRNSRGAIVVDVPSGAGLVQIGRGNLETFFSSEKSLKARLQVKNTSIFSLILETSNLQRYFSKFRLKKSDSPQIVTFEREDFVQTDDLLWYPFYKGNSLWETYFSPHSQVSVKTIEEGSKDTIQVSFKRGEELTETGYPYLGWAQFMPLFPGSNSLQSIPEIKYKASGKIKIRIKDANNQLWYAPLDETAAYKSITLSVETFSSKVAFPLKEFLFESEDERSTLVLQRMGKLKSFPLNAQINHSVFEINETISQQLQIFYLRPQPPESYTYVPYVAPFTVNLLNGRIEDWRGTAYTGYQAPWIWQELNMPQGVSTVLNFMERAQNEYYEQTGVEGFFMPVFIWDRWDSREYGDPNKFTWVGPDPNTFWGGFQYRGIETVARVWFNDKSNIQARNITMKFLNGIHKLWTNPNDFIITTFNQGQVPSGDYDEPHMAGLLLRTEVYAYLSTNIQSEKERLLRRISFTLKYLERLFEPINQDIWNNNFTNGTWSVDDYSWYNYWGGEILEALAMVIEHSTSLINIKTNYGSMSLEALPVNDTSSQEYVTVKTPLGLKKIGLVEFNNQEKHLSPLKIQTASGIKNIGGALEMDNLTRLLIKNASNVMKRFTLPVNDLPNLENGCLKVDSLKGKSLENISNKRYYDYSTGNWNNQFFNLKPNTTYNISFDVATPSDNVITLSMKNSSGSDYGWQDIGTINVNRMQRIAHNFTTGEDIVSMMLYLQTEGPALIDNILLIESSMNHIPDYFSGKVHFGEIKDNRSFEITVRDVDNKVIDSLLLKDIVPNEYLPLRSNGGTYDEVSENVLIKRIGDDGSVLNEPYQVLLLTPYSLVEVNKNCKVEIFEVNGLQPNIDIFYPVKIENII